MVRGSRVQWSELLNSISNSSHCAAVSQCYCVTVLVRLSRQQLFAIGHIINEIIDFFSFHIFLIEFHFGRNNDFKLHSYLICYRFCCVDRLRSIFVTTNQSSIESIQLQNDLSGPAYVNFALIN